MAPHVAANGLNLQGAGKVESRLMLQMPQTFIAIIRQLLNHNNARKGTVLELHNKMSTRMNTMTEKRNDCQVLKCS